MNLMPVLLAGAGGTLGAVLRYLVSGVNVILSLLLCGAGVVLGKLMV